MLKCPKCNNTKSFMCDIKGIGNYDQETDSFIEVGDFELTADGGGVSCLKCGHSAERSEFEVEGDDE